MNYISPYLSDNFNTPYPWRIRLKYTNIVDLILGITK